VAVRQRIATNFIIFPSIPEVCKILLNAGDSGTSDLMKCHRGVLRPSINILDNRIIFFLFIFAQDYGKISISNEIFMGLKRIIISSSLRLHGSIMKGSSATGFALLL
jgi:hypothetical protein